MMCRIYKSYTCCYQFELYSNRFFEYLYFIDTFWCDWPFIIAESQGQHTYQIYRGFQLLYYGPFFLPGQKTIPMQT